MNQTEYLLVCLMEEAAEVQQAAAKSLRFGLSNHHPERRATNCMELSKEIGQLNAIVDMLNKEHALDISTMMRSALEKPEKVEIFKKISQRCNILESSIADQL